MDKAPKWFGSAMANALKHVNERLDKIEAKVDRNTKMIFKAHPEFIK